MQFFLEDFIDTLSNRSTERISTILEEAKVGKEQISIIAERLVNFRDFAPLVLTQEVLGGLIGKASITANFRDLNLQFRELFRVDNDISDLLNSSKAIFSAEILALENEISALEKQVENYAFLLADGGSYDYAYMEPFSDDLNRDSFEWPIPDRASLGFGPIEHAVVRPDEGVLAISEMSIVTSPLTGSIVNGNATAMVVTNNGIENAVTYTSARGWRYVVATPNPVTSGLPEANGTTGAQVMLEFVLANPSPCTEIRIVPFSEHPIEVVRVISYEAMNGTDPFDLITDPISIDRPYTIHFPARTVARFQVLLNQSVYDRWAEVPTPELEYAEVAAEILPVPPAITHRERLTRPWEFPHTPEFGIWLDTIRFAKRKGILRRIRQRGDEIFTSIPRPFYKHWGDLREPDVWIQDTMREGTDRWDKNSAASNKMRDLLYQIFQRQPGQAIGFVNALTASMDNFPEPLGNSLNPTVPTPNASALAVLQMFREVFANGDGPSAAAGSAPADAVDSAVLFPPSVIPPTPTFNYKYFLGLEHISIGFGNPAQKSVFVTKPFNSIGDIGEIRVKTSEVNVTLSSVRDSNTITSVEYSVSNVSDPQSESDWIPILPIDDDTVVAERFLPDGAGVGLFRFPAVRSEGVTLYRNGITVPLDATSSYVYDASGVHILGLKLPTGETSGHDIFTVDYVPTSAASTINFADRGYDSIPLVASHDNTGAGEGFTGTGGNLVVTLAHYPYVDEDQIQENLGLRTYSPVTVILEDGTVCENITNYVEGVQTPLTDSTVGLPTYIHRGNLLMFNTAITQNFRVYYQYLRNNVRLRVVLRVNDRQFATPKVDFAQVKAKTRRPVRAETLQ